MISAIKIPAEWELGADPRYKRQNMERAMRGRIERGLVELITNSDDSYRNLEEERKHVSGKIRIEIERRKMGQPSVVTIRDRAEGMNRQEMYQKLGTLGKRTSGFEKGKARRGLHGRGARDVAAFGIVHFESIKDEEYNHLIIPPSLKCHFTTLHPQKVTIDIRKKLRIPSGNGTVVNIEVESRFRIPQHETLLKDFSGYYNLRDIFSNPQREVTLVDLNKSGEDRLIYKYPLGVLIFDNDIIIDNYPLAKVHIVVYKHSAAFEQKERVDPSRVGILVKSKAAIHDCTYFGLESETLSWKLTGKLSCDYIDNLVREYDDREEKSLDKPSHPKNNPQRLLDPFRDGLILEHPFAQALYKACKETLNPIIEKIKEIEKPTARNVTDKELQKKLKNLSKELSRVFEGKLRELEEKITPGTIPQPLSEGLHIIPPDEQPIILNQPKTFSVIVKHYEALDESLSVNIISYDPDRIKIHMSSVFLKKLSDDGKVGRTTFTVEGTELGAEAFIEAHYSGYSNVVLVKVVEPPLPPEVPEGLTFEKALYHVQINKAKSLALRLKSSDIIKPMIVAKVISDHPEIVIRGGGICNLQETKTPGFLYGQLRVLGRQLQAKGKIAAEVECFTPAYTVVEVGEHGEPPGGVRLRFDPDESNFGVLRYKWDPEDPYHLLIGANHSSIRRYLGEPTEKSYPGVNSPLYHAVLAEVIAEALAFRLLEAHFKRDGHEGMLDYDSTDLYYHRQFSEFLSISHKILVTGTL